MVLTTADDVATMLRWKDAEKAQWLDVLPPYIAAASQTLEDEAGPFELRTVTYTDDGGPSIALPYRPNAVQSVTVDGVAVDGWVADLDAGIVYGPFPRGRSNVAVSFTTGMMVIPESVSLACTMLVAHMWAIASQRATGQPTDFTTVPTGFLVPNAVKQLLAGAEAETMPGFA